MRAKRQRQGDQCGEDSLKIYLGVQQDDEGSWMSAKCGFLELYYVFRVFVMILEVDDGLLLDVHELTRYEAY
jgi:hypothetical protein